LLFLLRRKKWALIEKGKATTSILPKQKQKQKKKKPMTFINQEELHPFCKNGRKDDGTQEPAAAFDAINHLRYYKDKNTVSSLSSQRRLQKMSFITTLKCNMYYTIICV
jgi:hypothetical protein